MNVRSSSRLIALLALCAGAACSSEDSQPSGEVASPPPAAPAASAPAPELQRPPQSPERRQPPASGSAKLAYAGELPPLPVTSFPAARPPEVVNAVYEFAARRPDVLRYVPCFCGCERNGHTHNEDCFVAGREPDGKPRWDAHGLGWGICLDVARDAMQMHNTGVDLATIRKTIESRYRSNSGNITPTPPVPR